MNTPFLFLGNHGRITRPPDHAHIYPQGGDVLDFRWNMGKSESMYRKLYIVSEMNVKLQYIVNNYSLKS